MDVSAHPSVLLALGAGLLTGLSPCVYPMIPITLAIFGVIMKATWGASRHPKLALCLYLGMGWLGLIAIRPLSAVVPRPALIGLFAGGIAYTVGVIFFVNEQRRYNHFVWHLFVLTGTSCHFLALLACTG